MNKHQKFLEFNGMPIFFLDIEGTYWIAIKPICEALNIDADRSVKTLKKDPILGPARSIQTVQVPKNGQNQGRKMTCVPEKYIYGWIFSLRSDNPDLIEYKRTCYDLLYNHFHGAIGNRKELLVERRAKDEELAELEKEMKEVDELYIKHKRLKNERKVLSTRLNTLDSKILSQQELFES